jgi:DNA-binding HxlR family transcriptional regulator
MCDLKRCAWRGEIDNAGTFKPVRMSDRDHPRLSGRQLVADHCARHADRQKRYGEFLNSPEGITTNILANRLSRMEALGLISKAPYQTNPVRNEYSLTEAGHDLTPILQAMCRWRTSISRTPGCRRRALWRSMFRSEIQPRIRPSNFSVASTRRWCGVDTRLCRLDCGVPCADIPDRNAADDIQATNGILRVISNPESVKFRASALPPSASRLRRTIHNPIP